MRSITPNNLLPTAHGQQKVPPRRRKSSNKAVYSVVRPLVPPPDPPASSTPHKISFMEPSYNTCNNSFSSELSSSSSYNSITHGSHSGSSSESDNPQTDSLLPCDSLKEFYI